MKKVLTMLLAAIMTLSAFAGCASDSAGGNADTGSGTTIATTTTMDATEEAATTTPTEEEKVSMRIMSSNIWGDYFENEVQVREDNLLEVYKKYMPDVLGLQEATYNWSQGLLFVCLKREGYILLDDGPVKGRDNYTPMFIKADRFNVIDSGFEILRKTYDDTKSIQWAVLEEKESGKKFVVCNTHFAWQSVEDYEAARVENAEQLSRLMELLKDRHGCEAAFGFGDMNTTVESEVFTVYAEKDIHLLADSAPAKPGCSSWHGSPERGDDGLFHGEATNNPFEFSIDHIVGTAGEYSVTAYEVVTDQPALDATDHSPIYADIEF